MIPKELGLAWCWTGSTFYLQYFVKHQFEKKRLLSLVIGKQVLQEVLIITLPNGQEKTIKDQIVKVDKGSFMFKAADAIYRLPKKIK